MASLASKVLRYLEANGKTRSEIGAEGSNVQLVNDTGTDEIRVWNVPGVARPTDSQLNSYENDADKDEMNHAVRQTRRESYGNIGDQLDEIFKDIDAWKVRIQAIKDDNPKN